MLRSETAGSSERLAAALAGLRAYQAAPRQVRADERPVVAQQGRARLIDHGGTGRPVVVIPSLINTPDVLDLMPGRSLTAWLATRGLRPLLVDWGTPAPEERDLDIAGHVETLLLPLVEAAGADAALAGYCLGGTMALAAAAIRPPSALALIAAPWRFSGFPDAARAGLAELWQQALPAAAQIGLLPVEVLQTAFWRLDPGRTVGKFVTFGQQAADEDEDATRLFVTLEDWANGGAPLTLAAGRELVETLFVGDATGRGAWRVAGRTVDPSALACPVLDIVSATDRIVPAASAAGIGRPLRIAQGHVGMVVGGRREQSLWRPLASWLANPHMAG